MLYLVRLVNIVKYLYVIYSNILFKILKEGTHEKIITQK